MSKENWRVVNLVIFFQKRTMLSTHSTHLTRRFRLTIRPKLEYDGTNR